MNRAVLVLCVLAVSGVVLSAQLAREGKYATDDAVNEGGTYRASFCGGSGVGEWASANGFSMHVTHKLLRGWFEAEVSMSHDPKTGALQAPTETLRLNDARLCYVKVIVPTR